MTKESVSPTCSTPYATGRSDYLSGAAYDNCPFDVGTDDADEWLRGWAEAEANASGEEE